jgi:hypothetical protein
VRTRVLAALVVTGCCAAAAGAAPGTKTPLPAFRSPSGNIACLRVPGADGGPATLRCEIRRAGYAAALQRRCLTRAGLDWHGWELGAATNGVVTCSGGILYGPDTQRPVWRTLPYGAVWRRAPFTCRSARAGVTCTNAGGHGLFVSRESWRTW